MLDSVVLIANLTYRFPSWDFPNCLNLSLINALSFYSNSDLSSIDISIFLASAKKFIPSWRLFIPNNLATPFNESILLLFNKEFALNVPSSLIKPYPKPNSNVALLNR